ncbi:glycosyltransferase family 1 protein [Anaerococcus hydrogenalis]|uniref:glycosyltransferase family 1 protein n=1 Tax=Anaerococcus hydrogenalis TaxID=33029 RepID=UPI001DB98C31|nr:glycosyltransferase family 1 protein [Anaerococcus hydrogenalis]MBS5989426.1 glycosyltransferase family 1 protein [Anaerococcus hydrogenalis]
MKRIAIVSTVGLMYDGITSVILSYLEAMNLSDLEVYVIATIRKEEQIVKRLEKKGCIIVDLPSRSSNTFKYFKELTSFLRKEKIDVIHAHGNSSTLSIELLAGLLSGCKKRIAHSHNTTCNHLVIDKILHPLFNYLYTDALACGEKAGKWMFKNKTFSILKNGRDIEKYAFNEKTRCLMREKLNIQNKFVVAHVGGFNIQKNHKFLIKIFREILKIKPNSTLILIGDGPLKKDIEKEVEDINSNILFLGLVDNVQDYLQAMDAMILPSLYEGLPLVAIEWQINGLPCLLSDTITRECGFSTNTEFLSLNEDPKKWADSIIEITKKTDRFSSSKVSSKKITDEGFNIKKCAKILKNIYQQE